MVRDSLAARVAEASGEAPPEELEPAEWLAGLDGPRPTRSW